MSDGSSPPRSDDELTSRAQGYLGPHHGGADLWWASVQDLAPRHLALLNAIERTREQSYTRAADRDRFVVGVALSRIVLGSIVGVAASELELDRECVDCGRQHGRPRVINRPRADPGDDGGFIDFSLSHSGQWLAMVVGRGVKVGVDVEEIIDAPDLPSVARGVLSASELADINAEGGKFDPPRFYRQWVAKESALKAIGVGMKMPMNEVTVPSLDRYSGDVGFASRPGAAATVQRLAAPPGYVAATTTLTVNAVALRIVRSF